MPTIQRFGAVSVRMYADDHLPPHFHIVAPDFQVLVRISDLTVIAGEARPLRSPRRWHGRALTASAWLSHGRN